MPTTLGLSTGPGHFIVAGVFLSWYNSVAYGTSTNGNSMLRILKPLERKIIYGIGTNGYKKRSAGGAGL